MHANEFDALETLRILHAYEIGPPHGGECVDGVGVVVTSLCKKLAQMGHEVTFLTGQTRPLSPIEEWVDGYRVVRTDFLDALSRSWDPVRLGVVRGLSFPVSLALDGHAMKGYSFDLVHAHLYTSALAVSRIALKCGAPLLDTVHGTYAPAWSEVETGLRRLVLSNAERVLLPTVARLSTMQIHASEYSRRMAASWGISTSKLMTIRNGVDLEIFKDNARVPGPVPTIFTARRLVRKNGVDMLIRALAMLPDSSVNLMIAGTGPEEGALRRLVSELGVSQRVRFLGPVPHSQIPRYLSISSLSVIPSFMEASSLFALESMAAGVPVIASNVGGIPEIIRDGIEGSLVNPGDSEGLSRAIKALLEDTQRQGEYSVAARRRTSEQFTIERMASDHLAVYKRLLGGKVA